MISNLSGVPISGTRRLREQVHHGLSDGLDDGFMYLNVSLIQGHCERSEEG